MACHNSDIDGANWLNSISCLSSSLCVAADTQGNALYSTDPTGGAASWQISKVLSGPTAYGAGAFSDLTCIAGPYCVALYGTQIWTTSDPSAGSAAWSEANLAVPLYGVSCPSTSLCVAVDDIGNVLTSTNPTSASPSWNVTHATGRSLLGISCPGTTLCVATDASGDVVTSTDPTGAPGAWATSNVDGSEAIFAVSCPTTTFCAAVDDAGDVLTSTNPAGGAGAWSLANVDGNAFVNGISCPSSSFCAAVDDSGNVLVSTNPTGGAGAWQTRSVDPGHSLLAVSCVSTALCVAVDDAGNVVTSTAPASATPGWRSASVDNTALNAVSCPSTTMCVAVDNGGSEVNSINPAGGANEWTGTGINANSLYGVSCPDTSGCSVVDGNGNAAWGGSTPSNLTLPAIMGEPIQGRQLTEVHGTWTSSPTNYRLQWERCSATGAGCSAISGAAGPSYTVGAADVGSTIRVLELASNANGDGATVESPQTAVIQAASMGGSTPSPGPGATPGVGAGMVTIKHPGSSGTSAKVVVSCVGSAGATCALVVSLTVKETIKGNKVTAVNTASAKPRKKVVSLGKTIVTMGAGQTKIVTVSLNSAGKRLLSQRHTLRVTLAVTQSAKTIFSTAITFRAKPKKKH